MPANFAVPLLLYFWPQTGRLTPTLAGCNIKIGLNAYQKLMILTPKYKKFSGEGAVPFPRPYSSIPVRHAQPLRGLQSFDPPPLLRFNNSHPGQQLHRPRSNFIIRCTQSHKTSNVRKPTIYNRTYKERSSIKSNQIY